MNFSKKLRGFTLVEMLIVIVIIGVLAAALIPRLTSVRGRANDVARKADLQQLATAIVSYSMDKGEYPQSGTGGTGVSALGGQGADKLGNYMSSIPEDPTMDTSFTEYGTSGDYAYLRIYKGGSANQGFALISKAETEGGANRLYISTITGSKLDSSTDAQTTTPCKSMTKGTTGNLAQGSDCTYTSDSQLRYIIVR